MLNDRVVIVGGVGGSGTRAVAEVVSSLGVFMGANINEALDNLDWPSRQCAPLLRDRSRSYEENFPKISDAFQLFSEKMRAAAEAVNGKGAMWGTKVPGSFFYLRYLSEIQKDLRYIHVIRHGLDMAFSKNHNQLYNWGESLDISPLDSATPRQLLSYWARANTLALENCQKWLPKRHLVIKFEELCSDSDTNSTRIAEFLKLQHSQSQLRDIREKVVQQASQGRYKKLAHPEMFDECDLATLKKFGFSAEFS